MAELSSGVLLVWEVASLEAQVAMHATIKAGHFFIALCKVVDLPLNEIWPDPPPEAVEEIQSAMAQVAELRDVFQRAELDPVRCRRRLRGLLGVEGLAPVDGIMHRDPLSRRIFEQASRLAADAGEREFRPVHLLLALLRHEGPWQTVLEELGIAPEALVRACEETLRPVETDTLPPGEVLGPGSRPQKVTPSATLLLDRLGRDLTALARAGRLPPVIGRQQEILQVAQVLLQQQCNCPVLVGEAGVGKTCIAEGFAQRVVQENIVPELRQVRVVEVSVASLVAGTKYRGEFEERLQALVREASAPHIVLFIDEIHTLLGAGSGREALDAANILKPALARGEIRCIGATTPEEYNRYIERDTALQRRFQVVWVDEPGRQETLQILQGLRESLETHHGLAITDEALEAAVELSVRFLPTLRLPHKARQLLDEACALARLGSLHGETRVEQVTREHVAQVTARRCRAPLEAMLQTEQSRLLQLEEALKRRVFGQDEVLREIGEVLRPAEVGLRPQNRPRAVFLFMGPTGVGKTETCKALAEFLFGDENRLIRFDMSEFSEPHSVAKLIGSPPGYVGHEEGGRLVEAVRQTPYSVVLFDEFDRAHTEVHRLFLQMFDEGRLTDARGRQARFTECIIVLTTNLGASGAPERQIGFRPAEQPTEAERERRRQQMMQALRQVVPVELINRIDRILFFEPLGEESLRAIVEKALAPLRQRLAQQGIELRLQESAWEFLLEQGFQPEYGARSLERAVSHYLSEPLARMILQGEVADWEAVDVYKDEGTLRLEPKRKGGEKS